MQKLPLSVRCADAWTYIVFLQCKWLREDNFSSNVVISEFIELEAEQDRNKVQEFRRNGKDFITALQQKIDNNNNRRTKE